MAIDSNGVLWLGGRLNNRLTRFDGTTWSTQNEILGDTITNIRRIVTSPDGVVWINATFQDSTKLVNYANGIFTVLPTPSASWRPRSGFGVDSDSHLWAIFQKIGESDFICSEYDGLQWINHSFDSLQAKIGHDDEFIFSPDGTLYLVLRSSSGPDLLVRQGQQWSAFDMPAEINDILNQDFLVSMDHENKLWINLDNGKCLRFDNPGWTEINLQDFGFPIGFADGLRFDNQGVQWMIYHEGTLGDSRTFLYKWDGSTPVKWDLSNSGLPSNKINQPFIDPQNFKWFITNNGLLKFDGIKWIMIPNDQLYSYSIHGPTKSGGVWLDPKQSSLYLFDGVTYSHYDVTNPAGQPYNLYYNATTDEAGRLYVATGSNQVLVFDRGKIAYLDNMGFELSGFWYDRDLSQRVALDTFGRIHSIGYALHRFEYDSTWTHIPLWQESPTIHGFVVAPNGHIWVIHGIPIPDRPLDYQIWDGSTWSELHLPFHSDYFPKWNKAGDYWMQTTTGLCKFKNNTWHCYDESNSPLPNDRISSFVVDDHDNVWVVLSTGGLMVFNEDQIHSVGANEMPALQGHVFRDLDQNGLYDDTDLPLTMQRTLILPDSIIAFTQYDGAYGLRTPSGVYEIQYLPSPNWSISTTPDQYEIELTSTGASGIDFAVEPETEIIDLSLYLSEGFPRCHQTAYYSLSYNNRGTNSEDGEVWFIKDPQTNFYSSYPLPSWISGDTLSWTFSGLRPSSLEQIRLELGMPGVEDSIVRYSSLIYRIHQGNYILEDSLGTVQEIQCAFDPNDKIVRTIRTSEDGKSYPEDPLMYTIRFQNTGNDTAFQVVIRDTLDKDLDINTVEILGFSHPMTTFIKPGGVIEFQFANILLPDSSVNEALSHGFVSYRVNAKIGIGSPAIIENRASIYFDYNPGIHTNITLNEFVDLSSSTSHTTNLPAFLTVFPNPASDELFIHVNEHQQRPIKFLLQDISGHILQSGILETNQTKSLMISELPTGQYLITAITTTGLKSAIVVIID